MSTSALAGAILLTAIGFGWFGIPEFGWMTSGAAEAMAEDAVKAQLVTICAAQAQTATPADLKTFRGTQSSWDQKKIVEGNGWATMPGEESPERGVAGPCAEAILKT